MAAMQKTPKYIQLAENLREQVRSGALKPGERLQSFSQLHAQYGVGQNTLDRVYRVLEAEGLIVRSARNGVFVAEPKIRERTNVVGILTSDDSPTTPYRDRLWRGVQQVARSEKVELLILWGHQGVQWEKLDGLIQWPVIKKPIAMPTVTMMNRSPEVASVTTNDHAAVGQAVDHLVELGHRRIAFLTLGESLENDEISQGRLQGYKDALARNGIVFERSWARPLRDPWGKPGRFIDLGYGKMQRWLNEDWHALGCTAILAQNDETAAGMMRALREAGLSVPGDVSVVGFDGLEIAEVMQPSLTTLVTPLQEIGETAMRLLLQKIDAGASATSSLPAAEAIILPSRLRVGESTAPPKHS